MYEQYVLVEFDNTEPYVYLFFSKNEITLEKVIAFFEEIENINWEKDNVTFIDNPYREILE